MYCGTVNDVAIGQRLPWCFSCLHNSVPDCLNDRSINQLMNWFIGRLKYSLMIDVFIYWLGKLYSQHTWIKSDHKLIPLLESSQNTSRPKVRWILLLLYHHCLIICTCYVHSLSRPDILSQLKTILHVALMLAQGPQIYRMEYRMLADVL